MDDISVKSNFQKGYYSCYCTYENVNGLHIDIVICFSPLSNEPLTAVPKHAVDSD